MATIQQAISKIRSYSRSGVGEVSQQDISTRDRLILENAHLVKHIAARLACRLPPSVSLEDLESAGVIGLMDAIEKFDPTRNIQFKTYAEFRIRGAMLDELRSLDWVPRSARHKANQLEKAYSKIQNARGRPAEEEEVIAELGLDREVFYRLLQEVRGFTLLSESELCRFCPTIGNTNFLDLLSSSEEADPLQALGLAELREVIAAAIERLPERERLILALYYYEELTMREIAEIMDYTESRISQLHTQAILRMRKHLRNYFPDKEC